MILFSRPLSQLVLWINKENCSLFFPLLSRILSTRALFQKSLLRHGAKEAIQAAVNRFKHRWRRLKMAVFIHDRYRQLL